MNRRSSAVLLLGLVSAAACAPGAGETPVRIRASASAQASEPQALALEIFAKEVESRTEGRVVVEVFPASALGDEREVIELVVLGAVHAACPANAPLATFVPELLVLDLPFLFEDRAHLYRVLDGAALEALGPPLLQRGMRLLGFFDIGLRHVMTRNAPVGSGADLEGLKIRTMENPLHLAAFRAFGANPLPMAYGELYSALEQGVIDGAEAAAANYFHRRFHEVAPYWAEIGWMHLVAPFVMNESFFASLAEPERRAVLEAAAAAIAFERAEYRRQEAEAAGRLAAAGVRITRPETAGLRERAALLWERAEGVDPELVRRFRAAAGPPR